MKSTPKNAALFQQEELHMCNSNSLWGDNWLWWIILIIILIWVCGGQNGCCNDGNSCCGTGCCGC